MIVGAEIKPRLSWRRSIQAFGAESICASAEVIRGRISHNAGMRLLITSLLTGSPLLLGACAESPVPFEPQTVAVPAQVPSRGPRIAGDQGSGLILSWMEPGDDGTALRYSTYADGTWSEAKVVIKGPDFFVNWADMPSVTPLGGERLAAHWLQKSADLTYAYDVVFSQSADNGNTWSKPMRPHTDGTPTQHGFVSKFSDGSRTGLIWLDGRKMINEVTDDPIVSGMTLRAAFIDANLELTDEQLVDELICDCCQTDVAIAASGPVAVYRDRSVAEIRDISVTRFVDGRWQPGNPVAADQWLIPGCPVNGPSIAADGNTVAVAWFTGAEGRPVVKFSLSNDSGATFPAPVEVIDGSVFGRVGLVMLDHDEVAVSWLQSDSSGGGDVLVRKIGADGTLGPAHTVSHGAGSFSVPQLARADDDLIFVWTETDDSVDRIVSARVPLAAL